MLKLAKLFSASFLILVLSRVLGLLRELMISAAFGFSKFTDVFFQLTFPLVSLVTVINGPFTTAFSARLVNSEKSDRLIHIKFYDIRCRSIALWLGFFYVLAAAGVWFAPFAALKNIWLPLLVLAPAAFSLIYIGYSYAVLVALGDIGSAALVMLLNNGFFVFFVALLWALTNELNYWELPACYSLACLISSFLSARVYRRVTSKLVQDLSLREPRPLVGMSRSFWYASAETSVFLLTQFFVLSMASRAGTGWASGVSLSQRVCFSINGLIIGPLASILMIKLVDSQSNKSAKIFLRYISSVFLLLVFFSAGIMALTHYSVDHQLLLRFLSAETSNILETMLPAFGVWLIPLGVNILVCRIMFGLNMDVLYTVVTILIYIAANFSRFIFNSESGFVAAIYAGAFVEILGVLFLSCFIFYKLHKRDGKFGIV